MTAIKEQTHRGAESGIDSVDGRLSSKAGPNEREKARQFLEDLMAKTFNKNEFLANASTLSQREMVLVINEMANGFEGKRQNATETMQNDAAFLHSKDESDEARLAYERQLSELYAAMGLDQDSAESAANEAKQALDYEEIYGLSSEPQRAQTKPEQEVEMSYEDAVFKKAREIKTLQNQQQQRQELGLINESDQYGKQVTQGLEGLAAMRNRSAQQEDMTAADVALLPDDVAGQFDAERSEIAALEGAIKQLEQQADSHGRAKDAADNKLDKDYNLGLEQKVREQIDGLKDQLSTKRAKVEGRARQRQRDLDPIRVVKERIDWLNDQIDVNTEAGEVENVKQYQAELDAINIFDNNTQDSASGEVNTETTATNATKPLVDSTEATAPRAETIAPLTPVVESTISPAPAARQEAAPAAAAAKEAQGETKAEKTIADLDKDVTLVLAELGGVLLAEAKRQGGMVRRAVDSYIETFRLIQEDLSGNTSDADMRTEVSGSLAALANDLRVSGVIRMAGSPELKALLGIKQTEAAPNAETASQKYKEADEATAELLITIAGSIVDNWNYKNKTLSIDKDFDCSDTRPLSLDTIGNALVEEIMKTYTPEQMAEVYVGGNVKNGVDAILKELEQIYGLPRDVVITSEGKAEVRPAAPPRPPEAKAPDASPQPPAAEEPVVNPEPAPDGSKKPDAKEVSKTFYLGNDAEVYKLAAHFISRGLAPEELTPEQLRQGVDEMRAARGLKPGEPGPAGAPERAFNLEQFKNIMEQMALQRGEGRSVPEAEADKKTHPEADNEHAEESPDTSQGMQGILDFLKPFGGDVVQVFIDPALDVNRTAEKLAQMIKSLAPEERQWFDAQYDPSGSSIGEGYHHLKPNQQRHLQDAYYLIKHNQESYHNEGQAGNAESKDDVTKVNAPEITSEAKEDEDETTADDVVDLATAPGPLGDASESALIDQMVDEIKRLRRDNLNEYRALVVSYDPETPSAKFKLLKPYEKKRFEAAWKKMDEV